MDNYQSFAQPGKGQEDNIPGQYQDNPEKDGYVFPVSQDPDNPDITTDEVEIENPVSAVASPPAKNILIFGLAIIAAIFFLYNFVFKEDEKVAEQKKLQEQVEQQPVENAKPATKQEGKPQVNIGVVETPELPVIDNLQPLPPPVADNTLTVPEPPINQAIQVPPPVPAPAQPEPVKIEEPAAQPIVPPKEELKPITAPEQPVESLEPTEEQLYAKLMERRRSGMVVVNGGGTPSELISGKVDPKKLAKSGATQAKATKVENLGLMILQGKVIDAVLETTLNTDLPGSLRAIISRDVYAESGKTILIQRGSRLIGSYDSNIQKGQQRVIITWNRVIRPDGVDIKIDSAGTDQLGRAGVTGIVDNKYSEILGNSFLVSAVTVAGAFAFDAVSDSTVNNSNTNSAEGASTSSQTGKTSDLAVLDSVKNFSSTASKLFDGMLNTKPTIIVNQGARIKVFVNRDLVFPEEAVSKNISVGNQ